METSTPQNIFSDEQIRKILQQRVHPVTGTTFEDRKPCDQETVSLLEQRADLFSLPRDISFTQHVQPLLERICETGLLDKSYLERSVLIKLSFKPVDLIHFTDTYAALRKNVFEQIQASGEELPPFYMHVLLNWVNADFLNDYQ